MPRKLASSVSDSTPPEEGMEMRFVPALGYSILARDAADAEKKARKILTDQSTSPISDGQ